MAQHFPCISPGCSLPPWLSDNWAASKSSSRPVELMLSCQISNHLLSVLADSFKERQNKTKKSRTQKHESAFAKFECWCLVSWHDEFTQKSCISSIQESVKKKALQVTGRQAARHCVNDHYPSRVISLSKTIGLFCTHRMQKQPLSRQIPTHFTSHKINPEPISVCVEMKAISWPKYKKKALQMPTSKSKAFLHLWHFQSC